MASCGMAFSFSIHHAVAADKGDRTHCTKHKSLNDHQTCVGVVGRPSVPTKPDDAAKVALSLRHGFTRVFRGVTNESFSFHRWSAHPKQKSSSQRHKKAQAQVIDAHIPLPVLARAMPPFMLARPLFSPRTVTRASASLCAAPSLGLGLGLRARHRLPASGAGFARFASTHTHAHTHTPPPPAAPHSSASPTASSTSAERASSASPLSAAAAPRPYLTRQFWRCRHTWRRAMVNTFRCLVGCSIGDLSVMYYLMAFHPDVDMMTSMGLSSESFPSLLFSGLFVLLELLWPSVSVSGPRPSWQALAPWPFKHGSHQ